MTPARRAPTSLDGADADASGHSRIRAGTKFRVAWLSILVAGVAIRIVLALTGRIGYGALGYDHLIYEQLASSLSKGHGFVLQAGADPTFLRPPGYPAFLAIVHAVTGSGVLGVQLVQIGLWALLPILSAWLLRRYGRVAVMSALLFLSLDPFWLILPLTGLTETLSAVLILGGVSLAVQAVRGSSAVTSCALAGALLGLAALTRVNLLAALPGLAWAVSRGAAGRRGSLALVLGGILVFCPWLVRNASLGYFGVSTVSGVNRAAMSVHYDVLPPEEMESAFAPRFGFREFFPDTAVFDQPGVASVLWEPFQDGTYERQTGLSEVEIDRVFSDAASQGIRAHPGRYLWAIARNVWNFTTSFFESRVGILGSAYRALSLALLLLAALGAVAWARRAEPALVLGSCAIIVCCVASMVAVTLVYYRYRVPLGPLIAVLAALGVSRIVEWAMARATRGQPS